MSIKDIIKPPRLSALISDMPEHICTYTRRAAILKKTESSFEIGAFSSEVYK